MSEVELEDAFYCYCSTGFGQSGTVLELSFSTQPITWWQSIRGESGLHFPLLLQPEFTYLDVLSTESSVDDLGTCRGVVLRRAVTILRSIETQPLTGRFVRSVGQSSLAVVSFFSISFKRFTASILSLWLWFCARGKSFWRKVMH